MDIIGQASQLAGGFKLSPSWDLFIMLFFVVFIGYSLILGKAKITGILLSTYVALAIASESGNLLFSYMSKSGTGAASVFTIKIALFAAIITFFFFKSGVLAVGEPAKGLTGMMMAGVYGFFTAGLVLTSLASFMSDVQKAAVYKQSSLAFQLVSFRLVWLLIPIAFIIFFSFTKKKEK